MDERAGRRAANGSGGSDPVAQYLDLLQARDVRAARTLALSHLAAGRGLAEVITDLLVPAMAQTGDRWYQARWNAAQEHVASGITETVLAAATVRARSAGSRAAEGPTAVMACPRGEAHVLPARFFAELIAAAGADVITLGPPVPDRDLQDFLEHSRPTALLLSCTEQLALPGAEGAVSAAHRAGVPVLAGGAGFGPDDRRARALGADGWAAGADEALRLLQEWTAHPPEPTGPRPANPEVGSLRRLRQSFLDDVVHELVQRNPVVARYTERESARARADLEYVLAALSCSLLVDDDRLFDDFAAWSRGLLDAHGVPGRLLDESLEVISDELGPGFPGARRLLAAARADGRTEARGADP